MEATASCGSPVTPTGPSQVRSPPTLDGRQAAGLMADFSLHDALLHFSRRRGTVSAASKLLKERTAENVLTTFSAPFRTPLYRLKEVAHGPPSLAPAYFDEAEGEYVFKGDPRIPKASVEGLMEESRRNRDQCPPHPTPHPAWA